MTKRILIIAGSDSSGGAGIQADIKTVTMLGGHAMTAITSLTAQNSKGVDHILDVPTDMVIAQIDSVLADIGVDAIKIGMVGSAETAEALIGRLSTVNVPIVFDPVMIATSGATLANAKTVAAFEGLMRVSTITTPNLHEIQALAPNNDDPVAGALHLVAEHGCAVLLKGGHDEGDALVDALIEEDNLTSWQANRIATRHTHGTGCTMASALAMFLAEGLSLAAAVERARAFVRMALWTAPGLGEGHGPMGHQEVRLDIGGPMRLNQVTVGLADYDASVAFYRALGLKLIIDNPPDYARFEAWGGVTFSVYRIEDDEERPGGTTVYFECNQLDDEVMRLTRAGFQFDHPPMQQPWLWREARLSDPYGNRICLYQAGENRRFPPWRMT